jgi:hypothetical protein
LQGFKTPLEGFERHVKVFGTLFRAFHHHFPQPDKRKKFKRAFLTYSLGTGLPEFVHRLSFGVQHSCFFSFLLTEPPEFDEDFEPLEVGKAMKKRLTSHVKALREAVDQVVCQARHRNEIVEIDDIFTAKLDGAIKEVEGGSFGKDFAYCLHTILRIHLRWVLNDIENVLSALLNQKAPEFVSDHLHWTRTLLNWDTMIFSLNDLIELYAACIDASKDEDSLHDYPFLDTQPLPFSSTTYRHLSSLFSTPHPLPTVFKSLAKASYGSALARWLRWSTSQPRAARSLLHSRCYRLAVLTTQLTVLPLSTTPPKDAAMAPWKDLFADMFPNPVGQRRHGWPAELEIKLGCHPYFATLRAQEFEGEVTQENALLMALSRAHRLSFSWAPPVLASTRLPHLGSALVSDAIVLEYWLKPLWIVVHEADPKAWPGMDAMLKKKGKGRVGQISGSGASANVVPFCLPAGLSVKRVVEVKEALFEVVAERLREGEVQEKDEDVGGEEEREKRRRARDRARARRLEMQREKADTEREARERRTVTKELEKRFGGGVL